MIRWDAVMALLLFTLVLVLGVGFLLSEAKLGSGSSIGLEHQVGAASEAGPWPVDVGSPSAMGPSKLDGEPTPETSQVHPPTTPLEPITPREVPEGAPGWVAPSVNQVADAQLGAFGKPLPTRLIRVTERLVGAPYMDSPLGEGPGAPDPDPRIRFDAFDCTTFVETAIALAMSVDSAGALAQLDQIRYRDGVPDLLNRRHFPMAEWLPELSNLGYLRPITAQIAGEEVAIAKKKLNARLWAHRKHRALLSLPAERIPDGVFVIEVWPLELALAGFERIPEGTVLNLVRRDFLNIPVRVGHQGLVIRKGHRLYLRHAAQRRYRIVVDEPLDVFLLRMQQYKRWPVTGINLARVQDISHEGWRD